MTSSIPKHKIKSHNHQTILIDERGVIFESCDSIFNASPIIGTTLTKQLLFLESEFENILNSTGEKISFCKMYPDIEYLPGYYDFAFSKYQENGATFICWDIYDYSSIYENLINIQQLQNEIEILKQYQALTDQENNVDNFFQSNYNPKHKFELNNLMGNIEKVKLDGFNIFSENEPVPGKEKLEQLNQCANFLHEEIGIFTERVKVSQESNVNTKLVVSDLLSSKNEEKLNFNVDLSFDSELQSEVLVDKELLVQILRLTFCSWSGSPQLPKRKLNVASKVTLNGGLSLTFQLQERVVFDEKNVFRLKCILAKLSILKSLATVLGGALNSTHSTEKGILTINLAIPVK